MGSFGSIPASTAIVANLRQDKPCDCNTSWLIRIQPKRTLQALTGLARRCLQAKMSTHAGRWRTDPPVPHCDNTTELFACHLCRDQPTGDECRRAAATLPVDTARTMATEKHNHSVQLLVLLIQRASQYLDTATRKLAYQSLPLLPRSGSFEPDPFPISQRRSTIRVVCRPIVLPQKLEISANLPAT